MHHHADERKMLSTPLSNQDLEEWRICWRVNSAFSTKFDGQNVMTCIRCAAEILPGTHLYRSSFVSQAVESSCSHLRAGWLCNDCDMDMVFRITRGEEICFSKGCDEILSVDKSMITATLSKLPKLLAEYAILLGTLQVILYGSVNY